MIWIFTHLSASLALSIKSADRACVAVFSFVCVAFFAIGYLCLVFLAGVAVWGFEHICLFIVCVLVAMTITWFVRFVVAFRKEHALQKFSQKSISFFRYFMWTITLVGVIVIPILTNLELAGYDPAGSIQPTIRIPSDGWDRYTTIKIDHSGTKCVIARKSIAVIDIAGAVKRKEISLPRKPRILCVSPQCTRCCLNYYPSPSIQLIELETEETRQVFEESSVSIEAVKFVSEDEIVALVRGEGFDKLCLIDLESSEIKASKEFREDQLGYIYLSENRNYLAVTRRSNLLVLNPLSFEELDEISDGFLMYDEDGMIAISNDGRRVARRSEIGPQVLLKTREHEWKIEKTIHAPGEYVYVEEVRFLGNENIVINWAYSTSLEIYPLPDGPVSRLKRTRWRLESFDLSSAAKRVVAVDACGNTVVWEIDE
ncbi:MAG: hypothetical protein KDA84_24700 [Planctomycetaceae bacterium]|nr:hypothetical protein [Planctomycetaceae bacterium]